MDPSKSNRDWAVPLDLVEKLVGPDDARKMSVQEKLDLLDKEGYIVCQKAARASQDTKGIWTQAQATLSRT